MSYLSKTVCHGLFLFKAVMQAGKHFYGFFHFIKKL